MTARAIILSFLCLMFVPASAQACSCAMPSEDVLDRADAAIIGTVEEVDTSLIGREKFTNVRIERSNSSELEVGELVAVSSDVSGAACGLELREGARAGLLLQGSGDEWSGSLCGTTTVEWMQERIGRPRPGPVSRLIAWILAWLPGEARAGIVPASGCATPPPAQVRA